MSAGHAVVIGAGIGGLLAARVLAECHERVTVVDRDTLPGNGDARPGVPQGRHLHAVLTRGTQVLRELFPGLVEDLVAEGTPTGDILADGRLYFEGWRLARGTSDLPALSITRPRLEYRVRARVSALANVSIVAPRAVVGFVAGAGGGSVTGVRLADGTLAADLVVDASGRRSATPTWLRELGYPPPVEERIPIDVGYATCVFALPDGTLRGELGIVVGATADNPRGGGMIRIADGRWLVSLAGYRGTHPPVTLDGFLAFAGALVVPDIYEVLRAATPVGRPVRYRVPHATRRRYERLKRFPAGLVVLGDAVSSFNPLYGQGMSVAAEEALILRRCLRGGAPSSPRLRRKIARASAVAWTMSTSSDLRMPWIDGPRGPLVRWGNAYAARVYRASERDPVVARAFLRVANLVDAPTRLVRPAMAVRVLAGAARRAAPAAGGRA
jgi:2-polyprenyl-6-methoxyphenol hydroxylase-like FAD-dependent oxidoreductase